MRIAVWCVAVGVLLLAGCEEKAAPRVSGTALIKGQARDVYVSPNGSYVATLTDPEPSKDLGAPQDILQGELMLIPVAGGKSHRIGNGVPNLPGKVIYSKDSASLACLANYSVAHGLGELRLGKTATGDVESLADNVTYFSFSPSGDRIAYISGGDLSVRPTAAGPAKQIASSVSLIEFSPAGDRLLVKQTARSGGKLAIYDLKSGKLTDLARGVENFGFSPSGDAFVFRAEGLLIPGVLEASGKLEHATKDAAGFYRMIGNGPPRRLATENISDFKFSPKGDRLAWVTPAFGSAPVGDLFVAEGDEAKRVAPRVMQFLFAPDSTIYLMGVYDPREQAGTLGYLPPSGKLVELSRDVRHFSISPEGKYVLYSKGVAINGTFTLALEVHRVAAPADEKPRRIDTGVFGYVLDKQEQHLAYKARCTEAGQACSLFVTTLDHPSESIPLAQRVAAFDFAPSARDVVIATSRHDGKLTGRLLYALGVVATEPNATVQVLDDQMNGDFTLAGPEHDRVVYLVGEKGREGLYVSGLTPPPQPATAARQ